MLRRVIAGFALVVVATIGLAMPATADTGSDSAYPASAVGPSDYPAPPVSTSIEVLGENSFSASSSPSNAAIAGNGPSANDPSSAPSDDLAFTGVSFNVTLVVTIAVLVLLVGASLVLLGARGIARSRSRHSHS